MAVLDGTQAADTLTGGGGDDAINGLDGPDVLDGGGGDDIVHGHSSAGAAAGAGAIDATVVASGLAAPVCATAAPGDPGHLYIVEKDVGRIVLLDLETGAQSTFLDIPDGEIGSGGEQGVLGLAFHPDYADNGRFFVDMVNAAGDLEVREYARSAADPLAADPESAAVLTVPHPTFGNHNGGFIGFSPNDGYLYMSTGDGGGGGDPDENAQDLESLLGKLLRIDVDGDDFPADPTRNYAIPASNPFAGTAGADEIWAYGLRNPFRMSFDSANGDIYIGDVGQNRIEEIDYQPGDSSGGLNYGWDVLEGTLVFEPPDPGEPDADDPSLVGPVFEYGRELGQTVIGGYVYHGPAAGLQGAYVFADFLSDRWWTLRMVDGVATDVVERTSQLVSPDGALTLIASFGLDGEGNLYAVSLGGSVFRIDPAAAAGDSGDILSGGDGADQLFGGIGIDALYGGTGNDDLDGGVGTDFMLGQMGDDTYRVDDTFDLVDEGAVFPDFAGPAGDFDTIISTAEWFWDVNSVGERLVIADGAAGSGPGEAGATIVGSVFSNEMIGNAGTNIMFGRGGSDTYRGGDGTDWVSLSLLGLTDENAYDGVDGVNTIVVDPRSTGDFSYDIVFEYEPGKDKADVSAYGYSSGAEALALGVNDGAGNSYFALGDGLDYLYLVGVTTGQMSGDDFVV